MLETVCQVVLGFVDGTKYGQRCCAGIKAQDQCQQDICKHLTQVKYVCRASARVAKFW